MGLFNKRETLPQEREQTAALRRIAAMSTSEFVPWIESSLYQIGRSLADYQRDGGIERIDEALMASEVSTEMLQELKRRIVTD